MSMTPNEYKEAAEALLAKAERCTTNDFGSTLSVNRIRSLTSIARVYAMLAAIPDTTVHDRVPFNTGKTRVSEDHYTILRRNEHPADGDTTPSEAEALAIQHRHHKATMEHKRATGACMMWGCSRSRRPDGDYCDGHDRDTIG